MNSEIKWYDFPQKIKTWSTDIDYVMFIDENGSAGKINDIFKKLPIIFQQMKMISILL